MVAEGLQPGDEIAGYRVERDLGAGGMGMVYLVLQPSLGKRFALKLLPAFLSNEPEFVGRFEREMRTVSRLDHPNIVATTNAGTSDSRVWYTMTYVRGTDGAGALKTAPHGLAPEQVLRIIDGPTATSSRATSSWAMTAGCFSPISVLPRWSARPRR